MNYYKKYLKYKLKYFNLNGGVGSYPDILVYPNLSKQSDASKNDECIGTLINKFLFSCEFTANLNKEKLKLISDALNNTHSPFNTVTFNYIPDLKLFSDDEHYGEELNEEQIDLIKNIKENLKLKQINTLRLNIILLDDNITIVKLDYKFLQHLKTLIFNPNRLSGQLILSGKFINLTHLEFGDDFNTVVDLEFGDDFNTVVDLEKLPNLPNLPKLTHLTFGKAFNTVVDLNTLKNLTHLKFGFKFNQKLDLSKCKKLIELCVGYHFNNGVVLRPEDRSSQSITPNDASDDNKFDISNLTNLQSLHLGHNFNTKLVGLEKLEKLTKLKLGKSDNFTFSSFNQELDLSKCKNLTELELGDHFNHKLDLSKCENLTELTLGKEFNNGVKCTLDEHNTSSWPNEELDDNNFDISNLINLESLNLGSNFNVKLVGFENLTKLTKLQLGKRFNKSTQHLNLTTFRENSNLFVRKL